MLFEGHDPGMYSQGGGILLLIASIGKAMETSGACKHITRNWGNCMSKAMLIWHRSDESISQGVERCTGEDF